jgi:hypothetical protein
MWTPCLRASGLDQRVGLFGPAGGGVKAPLQIARGLRPVERRQFHPPVFGKHQKIGPRLRPGPPMCGSFPRRRPNPAGNRADRRRQRSSWQAPHPELQRLFASPPPRRCRASRNGPPRRQAARIPVRARTRRAGGSPRAARDDRRAAPPRRRRPCRKAQPRRVRLPPVEEGMSRALPPILRKQNGFSAVEDVLHVDVRPFEGRREIVGMIGQRHARRRADHPVAVIGRHDDAVAPGVAREVPRS